MIKTAAIVLAGGSGTRFGGPVNKVYVDLDGRPVLAHSLATLRQVFGTIVVVRRREDHDLVAPLLADGELVADGGATRTASERSGLEQLRSLIDAGAIDVVAIHDGARPFVTPGLCAELVRVARQDGGAIPGLAVDQPADAPVDRIVERAGHLFRVQTPQAFDAGVLLEEFDRAKPDESFADTAGLVERYTRSEATIVTGELTNVKLTFAEDLAQDGPSHV